MMSSNEMAEIRYTGNELHDELSIHTRRLNSIESDGINLQCVNSSDFTVGKQTNFNGPVTIINYADESTPDNLCQREGKAEEIVIKEITEPEVTSKMDNFISNQSVKKTIWQFKMGKTKHGCRTLKVVCMKNFFKIPVFVWSLILFLVFAGCITLAIDFSNDELVDVPETIPGDTQNYTLYSKKHWGAAEEESSVEMKLPVPYVVISSTGYDSCNRLKDCKKILKEQQNLQMKRSESDIYPNFLVSSDGSIYEGRGWNKRNAFFGFVNSQSLEISFIGDFAVHVKPTKNQTEAAKAFIRFALTENKLEKNYRLIPANATGITLLQEDHPLIGGNLYDIIKNWPQFTPDPYLTFLLFPPIAG